MAYCYSFPKDIRNINLIQFWNCSAYLCEDLAKTLKKRRLTYTDMLLLEQKSDLYKLWYGSGEIFGDFQERRNLVQVLNCS